MLGSIKETQSNGFLCEILEPFSNGRERRKFIIISNSISVAVAGFNGSSRSWDHERLVFYFVVNHELAYPTRELACSEPA